MITIEDVNKAWSNYEAYKETAEQHEFLLIFMTDLKLVPLYKDLKENWNDHNAEIFMKCLGEVGKQFGFALC